VVANWGCGPQRCEYCDGEKFDHDEGCLFGQLEVTIKKAKE